MARMAEGVPCARLSVSMPLSSVASLTPVVPHGLPLQANDCRLPSGECHLLCSTAQHPAPRTESEMEPANKGCSVLAAGLPAKQAVLLHLSVSASSKDPAFAAPGRPLSVLGATAEAGLSSEQADESGGPEGSGGCRVTKAARRLSPEALPHHQ